MPRRLEEEQLLQQEPRRIIRLTPLTTVLETLGARTSNRFGWRVAEEFASSDSEVVTLRESVGLADWSWLPKFDLRGGSLRAPPRLGHGATSWCLGRGHYLVTCMPKDSEALTASLEERRTGSRGEAPPKFYVTDVTAVYAALLLAGPRSVDVLNKLVDMGVPDRTPPQSGCVQIGIAHVRVILFRWDVGSNQGYLILVHREYAEWLWNVVSHAGREFALQPLGLLACEQLGGI